MTEKKSLPDFLVYPMTATWKAQLAPGPGRVEVALPKARSSLQTRILIAISDEEAAHRGLIVPPQIWGGEYVAVLNASGSVIYLHEGARVGMLLAIKQ